jgi:hypothetical protein
MEEDEEIEGGSLVHAIEKKHGWDLVRIDCVSRWRRRSFFCLCVVYACFTMCVFCFVNYFFFLIKKRELTKKKRGGDFTAQLNLGNWNWWLWSTVI